MAIILELKIIISERTLKKISKNLTELKSTPKGLQAEFVMSRVPLWKVICSVGCSILGTHDLVTPVIASCLCWQGPELGELVSPLLWSSPRSHQGALHFSGRNLLSLSQVLQPSVWVLMRSSAPALQPLTLGIVFCGSLRSSFRMRPTELLPSKLPPNLSQFNFTVSILHTISVG